MYSVNHQYAYLRQEGEDSSLEVVLGRASLEVVGVDGQQVFAGVKLQRIEEQ